MTDDSQKMEGPVEDQMDRTEQLIWKYLDETLPEQEFQDLESLLQSDDQAVQLYVDCVKLHTDLIEHFQELKEVDVPTLPNSPVLGSLGEGMSGMDAGPPVTDK